MTVEADERLTEDTLFLACTRPAMIAGVPMEAMTGYVGGSGHAWSRLYQNGTYYNVDVTWCDPVPDQPGYCDDAWFWVSDNYLKTCSEPRTFDIDTTSKAA